MRKIRKIILHCSYTPPSMDIGADEIRTWHVRDNGWKDIGYHWVIRRDGIVDPGRPETAVGAHCAGHNADSIGICLVGGMSEHDKSAEFNYTAAQMRSLSGLVEQIEDRYGELQKRGHRDFIPLKQCPCFDVMNYFYPR